MFPITATGTISALWRTRKGKNDLTASVSKRPISLRAARRLAVLLDSAARGSAMTEYSFCSDAFQSLSPEAVWHIRKRSKPTTLCGRLVQDDVAAEFTEGNLKEHDYHICDGCRAEYRNIAARER